LPFVIWGKFLGKKIITHEQTTVVGLANKIISKFADRVLVSWPESLPYFPENKTALTGNPIRKEVLTVTINKFKFADDLPIIYITGGNQGANTINRRLLKILPHVLAKANIIHQTGKSSLTNDYEQALAVKAKLPGKLQKRYVILDNVFASEIGEIFHKADLIVSRAGANTVTEVLALGKLAVLVPLPWSSHHEQLRNAELAAATGLGLILKQYDNMPAEILLAHIRKGLAAFQLQQDFKHRPLKQAITKAKQLIKLHAAELVAQEVISQLK